MEIMEAVVMEVMVEAAVVKEAAAGVRVKRLYLALYSFHPLANIDFPRIGWN